jgi:ABC-type lipoprotein export system ATPase subunit
MTLLALEQVSKRHRSGRREQIVLSGIDLQVRSGELVVVYGQRRSGRTTLLRVAAGLQRPDRGCVRFEGMDVWRGRASVLGEGIGYVRKTLRASEEPGVLEQVMAALLTRGTSVGDARQAARAALARAGAEGCAAAAVDELSGGESVRVALARALSLQPALIVVDEPAAAVGLSERDGLLAQLRALAGAGTAVLMSSGEPSELAGAHRGLTLAGGELRGEVAPELAPVVALRRSS